MSKRSGRYWTIGRFLLAAIMMFAGAEHFLHTDLFARIVPQYLPKHVLLVQISGVCEIAGGLGLLIPQVAPLAAIMLTLLLVAVFPANIAMALHNMPVGGRHYSAVLWLRLPVQIPLIVWAFSYTGIGLYKFGGTPPRQDAVGSASSRETEGIGS